MAVPHPCLDMPDPVGQVDQGSQRPNGLSITRVRVPLGVVGIIYEARLYKHGSSPPLFG